LKNNSGQKGNCVFRILYKTVKLQTRDRIMHLKEIKINKCLISLLVGLLFLLPHIVRIFYIGSFRDYTPFAGQTPSSTVWDETFMYASQVNFTLQQHGLANDTDAFEHRSEPFPYSIIPIEIEAGIAKLTGNLGTAQILCHFLFPAITAWLMMTLLGWYGASTPLAALLGLAIMVVGFSPRTVMMGNMDVLRRGLHASFAETLQFSRNPHPNMSFPFFLAAAMSAAIALSRKSVGYSVLAGLLGGLLFYTYIFYAIDWTVACILLFWMSFWKNPLIYKNIRLTLFINMLVAIPFLLWVRASKLSGAYFHRTYRLGMMRSHLPTKDGLELGIAWIFMVAIATVWFLWSRRSKPSNDFDSLEMSRVSFLVFTCAALGGIIGMNMQIVTGFNVQAEHHFPHMVIQPTVLILLAIAFVGWTKSNLRIWQYQTSWSVALFVMLFTGCTISQVDAAVHSAPYHRITTSDRILFKWLKINSSVGDVVATTNLRLCTIIPVYTHDYTLLVNGSRTSGTDEEVIERFLLASALTRTPVDRVAEELRQSGNDGSPPPLLTATYSYFMFEHSPYFDGDKHRIFEPYVPKLLAEYRDIRYNIPAELLHFRVNYIYTEKGQTPALVTGWHVAVVLQTQDGDLWKLQQD
jgi:hypothetical protein